MARLMGQISFILGATGFVMELSSHLLDSWQFADGGFKMGVWRQCDEDNGCNPISGDGLSTRQTNTLWATRIILIMSKLAAMVGCAVASMVMQLKGRRRFIHVGAIAFFIAAFLSMLVMSMYIDQLETPAKGQRYGTAMAFIILCWLVLYPAAGFVLRVALGTRRYEDPTYRNRRRRELAHENSLAALEEAVAAKDLPAGIARAVDNRKVLSTKNKEAQAAANKERAAQAQWNKGGGAKSPSARVSNGTPAGSSERTAWVDGDGRAVRGLAM